MYEGWKSDTGKRSVFSEKTVYAGVESSEDFHEKWEPKIQSIYDPSKIGVRVLNWDGGSWIYDEYDAGAIHQLDRFHVAKMIRQNVSHKETCGEMLNHLRADKEEAVERYTDIEVWTETVKEKLPEPLSAGRVPKVDGKGINKYYEIMNVHLPITESSNSQSVKVFKRLMY